MVNCLIDPALILSLVLIAVDPTLQLPFLVLLTFLKSALEFQATKKLTFKSVSQHIRDPPREPWCWSYSKWLLCSVFPLSVSPAPAFAATELISPKRTSVYSFSASTTIATSNRFVSIASTVPIS